MDFRTKDSVRASDDIREELQPYVISQYSASPTITRLLGALRKAFDAQPDLCGFYDALFSLERAGEFGMDVWSRILNIPRTFIDETSGEKYTLTGDSFKLLLWLKAAANIAAADLPTFKDLLLQALQAVSDSGVNAVYVRNELTEATQADGTLYNATPMHIMITMDGELNAEARAILLYAIPFILAAGVWWRFLVVDSSSVFGFAGSGLLPFDQGVLVPDDAFIAGWE